MCIKSDLNRSKSFIILSNINLSTSENNIKNNRFKSIHNSNKKVKLKKNQEKSNRLNFGTENISKSISTKDSSFSSTKKNYNNNKSININFKYSIKNYCNYIPTKDEMMEKPHKVPCFFPTETFHGQNESHYNIGDKQLLNIETYSYFNKNNDSYKAIDRKDHILINHLCLRTVNKKIINSFTIKYRHKNTTFLYFK